MGQLRDRMEQDLILRRLSPSTRRNYLLYCRKFAAHYLRPPEELREAEKATLSEVGLDDGTGFMIGVGIAKREKTATRANVGRRVGSRAFLTQNRPANPSS